MTKNIFLILALITCIYSSHPLKAQLKGYRLDFNKNNWVPSYSHPNYTIQNQDSLLHINANGVGSNYQNFVGTLPTLDLRLMPQVLVKIKTE